MNAQGVAAQQHVNETAPDEFRQTVHAAWMYDYGSRHGDHFQTLCDRVLDQRSRLPYRGFHLALRGNSIRHERKGQAIAFLRFRYYTDAAHSNHHVVAGPDIP